MLDRESPIALYYQIAADIRRRIGRGEWTRSQRIPSEIELAQEYGVSRMTLRQALEYLEKEGVLSRKRGLGTFVETELKDLEAPPIFPLSFKHQMQELGLNLTSELIRAATLADIEPETAILLGLEENESAAYFERLFYANGNPIALIKSMLPEKLCPGITEEELIDGSLTTTLEKKYNLTPTQFDQWISVGILTEDEISLLDFKKSTAALEIKTLSYDDSGQVIEYAKMLSVQDLLAFHIFASPMGKTNSVSFEYVVKTSEQTQP